VETRLTISAVSASHSRNHSYSRSPVIKRSIRLVGNKTSVSLENQFWDGLREIARRENVAVSALIERIDTDRIDHNLSSAVRLFVLDYFKMHGGQQIVQNARPDTTAK
jgi:predicted DNA-binding ribbon-helix-helix protein